MTDEDDDDGFVTCDLHGVLPCAIVCCHMVREQRRAVGFIENSDDPADLQAWCEDCERVFLAEGDKTDAFRKFNDFSVVCTTCYGLLKSRHGR